MNKPTLTHTQNKQQRLVRKFKKQFEMEHTRKYFVLSECGNLLTTSMSGLANAVYFTFDYVPNDKLIPLSRPLRDALYGGTFLLHRFSVFYLYVLGASLSFIDFLKRTDERLDRRPHHTDSSAAGQSDRWLCDCLTVINS